MPFIQDLQYMYRGMEGPYYSLYCRRSQLPKSFCDLIDLIHSCTLAAQYAESKKSFIPKKQPIEGLSHRIYQSTDVLLMQVLQAAVSLHKQVRISPQLMRSREWQMFERDLSWWLENHTRAVLSTNTIAGPEIKSIVNRLPAGMVHMSIVDKLNFKIRI